MTQLDPTTLGLRERSIPLPTKKLYLYFSSPLCHNLVMFKVLERISLSASHLARLPLNQQTYL